MSKITYAFTFEINKKITPNLCNKLAQVGCNDCVPVRRDGKYYLNFDRVGLDKNDAVNSALLILAGLNIGVYGISYHERGMSNNSIREKVAIRLKKALREDLKLSADDFKETDNYLRIKFLDWTEIRLYDFILKSEKEFLVVFLEHQHPMVFWKEDIDSWKKVKEDY